MRGIAGRLLVGPAPFALAVATALAAQLAMSGPLASVACAQSDADRATARELGQAGQAALAAQDYAAAADRFRRADALYRAPTLALGLARAEAGLGHFLAAQEAYNKVLQYGAPQGSPPAFLKAVTDAERELPGASAKVGALTLSVSPAAASARALLDGAPYASAALGVRRPIDPGTHQVAASAEGYRDASREVVIAPGEDSRVELTLEAIAVPAVEKTARPDAAPRAADAARPSGRPAIGYVALGVGAAGIVVGGVSGALAIAKHGTLSGACAHGCPASAAGDLDAYHALGTTSTVGFIVGGVGLAAGAVLLLTARGGERPAARLVIAPSVSASGAGAAAAGRF